jgi:SAM-dependent methyltransferase
MNLSSSLGKLHHLLHSVQAVLTDLGYLVAALSPRLRRLARAWARPRYRRLAGQYDRYVKADAAYFAPLLQILDDLPEAEVIVDVGAGTGAATRRLQQRYPSARIVAIDLSPPMLSHLPDGIAGVVGDVSALPIASGRADLVVVHNAPFAPDELYRIVRRGGVIAVVLSAAASIPSVLPRLALRRAAPPSVVQVHEHRAGAGAAWIIQR